MEHEVKPEKKVKRKRSGCSVSLPEKSSSQLSKMISEIKSEETSVNKSSLSSWIINWFVTNRFKGLLPQMKKDFFNARKSFRGIYKDLSDEDVERFLKLATREINRKKR